MTVAGFSILVARPIGFGFRYQKLGRIAIRVPTFGPKTETSILHFEIPFAVGDLYIFIANL